MNMDTKYNWLYLKHIRRTYTPWSPIFKVNIPTVFYYMDRFRYGKYFEKGDDMPGEPMLAEDFRCKNAIQGLYQQEMEKQGAILRAIYLAREATEDSKVVDYLGWIGWQWSLYQSYLKKVDAESSMEFLPFVQSSLSYCEELTEPDCYGKNRNS